MNYFKKRAEISLRSVNTSCLQETIIITIGNGALYARSVYLTQDTPCMIRLN